jgi:diguanylate cyclase (GGDEF)-like protein
MTSLLNAPTLLITGASTILIIGVIVGVILWRRGLAKLGAWNLANAAILLSLLAAPLRDIVPPPIFIVAYNGFNLLALCCFASTSTIMLAGASRWKFHIVLALGTLAVLLAISFLTGERWPRTVIVSVAAAVIALRAAFSVRSLSRRENVRNGPGILSFMFGFAGFFYLLRAAWTLHMAAGGDLRLPEGFFDSASYLVVIILFTSFDFALLVILMTNLERQIAGKVFELSESRNELQILYDAFTETAGSVDLEELAPRILGLLKQRLKVDQVVLYLREPGDDGLQLIAQYGLDSESLEAIVRPPKDSSVAWQAFGERKAAVKRIADYPAGPIRAMHERLGTAVVGGFPIAARGESLGALVIGYREESGLDEARTSLLETLSLQLGAVVRAASLHDELDRANARLDTLASTDTLTGLANRRTALQALEREIARARRNSQPFAVIMADIDHFKQFNDRYGHDCGDYVLAKTASIIKGTVRATDLASRWGGEEFLVILGPSEPRGIVGLAERLRSTVETAVWNYGGAELSVTITLGLAVCPPEAGEEGAIAKADEALYKGKREGRNRVMLHGEGDDGRRLVDPTLADLEGPDPSLDAEHGTGDDSSPADLLQVEEG